jgi:hypothetical protein
LRPAGRPRHNRQFAGTAGIVGFAPRRCRPATGNQPLQVFLLMPSELEVLQFMALIRRATIRRVAESFVPLHKKLPLMILRMRTQSQALKVCRARSVGSKLPAEKPQKVTAY